MSHRNDNDRKQHYALDGTQIPRNPPAAWDVN